MAYRMAVYESMESELPFLAVAIDETGAVVVAETFATKALAAAAISSAAKVQSRRTPPRPPEERSFKDTA